MADILSGPVDFAVFSESRRYICNLIFSAEEIRWAVTWIKWIWVTQWVKGTIKTAMEKVIQ